MILDLTPAFENGNQGVTVYPHPDGFMVSVKSDMGGFSIGFGATPADSLNDALRLKPKAAPAPDDDILGDLL